MSTTQFVRVRFIATDATGTVPEGMLSYYLANGYELITDEEAVNTPFPYVRAIGELSGRITIEDLLEAIGDGIGDVSDAAVAALRTSLVGGAPDLLNTLDELAAALGDDPNLAATVLGQIAAVKRLKAYAKNPDLLIAGAITYTSGLVSSAVVEWPDGKAGVLTITSRQAGTDAVLSYTITHVDGATTLTYTQPAITRDSAGNATNVPQITVA